MIACPEINIIPRTEWSERNCTEVLENIRNLTEPFRNMTLPVKYMVYTHTFGASCNNTASCSSIVREIQNYHMESPNYFADIGYNFLIGEDGSIFEGRGWHLKGAFNPAFNSKGFGTAFIGRYPPEGAYFRDLTYAAAKSANGLYKCALRNSYLNPANYSVITSRINPVIQDCIMNPENLLPSTTAAPSRTIDQSNGIVEVSPVPRDFVFTDGIIAGITFGVLAPILLVAFFILYLCKCRNKHKAEDYRAAIHKLIPQNVVAYYERPRWSIELKDVCLGVGHYGQVYKGSLMDKTPRLPLGPIMSGCRPVAVKMLRKSCSDSQGRAGFLAEMSILMKVGKHMNIVQLEGVVLRGRLMMVTEYCELGSLDKYLGKLEAELAGPPQDTNNTVRLDISNVALGEDGKSRPVASPDITELTNIAHQISQGMEFLSSKNVVHCDLAARNILLTAEKTAKIADFGMAKEQEYILGRDKVRLPVCWMAPESVIPGRGIFSTQSDVWSFGIVLWEIFTLGSIPYAAEFPSGALCDQLCSFLQEGNHLQTPELCPTKIALLMEKCWNFQPENRPAFSELARSLEILLPEAERARYVLVDAENETLNRCLSEPAGESICSNSPTSFTSPHTVESS